MDSPSNRRSANEPSPRSKGDSNSYEHYNALAAQIRGHILKMSHRAHSSHVGGSLSIADILAVLYSGVLRLSPSNLDDPYRDRFVLSKGHGCSAVYAVLAELGYIPKKWLETYGQNGSYLFGHITHGIPAIEASTGSLGHGLSIGCGMSMACKSDSRNYRVFVLLSDGDCQEGSTWEAALFASHHNLDNLVAIVDYNKIQAFGRVEEVLQLEPLAKKWQAFGWTTLEIDGHNYEQIEKVLQNIPFESKRPSCVIAHTVKGKGISFMENQLSWHYKCPDAEELRRALVELGI